MEKLSLSIKNKTSLLFVLFPFSFCDSRNPGIILNQERESIFLNILLIKYF